MYTILYINFPNSIQNWFYSSTYKWPWPVKKQPVDALMIRAVASTVMLLQWCLITSSNWVILWLSLIFMALQLDNIYSSRIKRMAISSPKFNTRRSSKVQLILLPVHESHETCHSFTFIVLVNSHQRWKQTRFRVCFHLLCELTLASWCHNIIWSLFFMK